MAFRIIRIIAKPSPQRELYNKFFMNNGKRALIAFGLSLNNNFSVMSG